MKDPKAAEAHAAVFNPERWLRSVGCGNFPKMTYEVEIEVLQTCLIEAQSKEEAILLAKLKHQHLGEIVSAVAEEIEKENDT